MPRHLPPLMAVRAFEAAARHGGFSKAAEELCVTAGAVAHHVKQLEEWLGLALFVRQPRSVELTEIGRSYFADVRTVLEDLERASNGLRQWADACEITVTAMPSFVTRWLMPRLGSFRKVNPDIEVRLLASVPPVDFVRDRVDVAIRLGPGPYPGLHSEPLLEERFLPVASPALIAEMGRPRRSEDLLQWTLLHDEFEERIPEQIDWRRWFEAQGVPQQRLRRLAGPRFSHSYLTLDAAAAGQGVAMASDVLCDDALRAGTLAVVLNSHVAGPYSFHLLTTRMAEERQPVRRFASWLRREAAMFDGAGTAGGRR